MYNWITDIEEFHEKFGTEYRDHPRKLPEDERNFRSGFLMEEAEEYKKAQSLEDELDALVDLIYVALGTAYRQGLPIGKAWERVHEANMKKINASSASDSKRNFAGDVIKPEGWQPPDHSDLVQRNFNPALISHKGKGYARDFILS
jgi:predicted HAD superfamily Cof-like phosphohydrolase